jgi:hypothetical protein
MEKNTHKIDLFFRVLNVLKYLIVVVVEKETREERGMHTSKQ